MKQIIIGVVGSSVPLKEYEDIAFEVGKLIAEKEWVLITGGLGGVMEKACEGAKSKAGLTIGVLPGSSKKDANQFVDVPIVTAMQQARNNIVVQTADIIVAIGAGFGTLAEIATALKINKPVISISSWDVDEKVIRIDEPQEVIAKIEKILKKKKK
ncbi:TIGR00725 family protein [bacterium]|nr:TIGR00725 family protein [bacterium]